jgi:hypothetical protein
MQMSPPAARQAEAPEAFMQHELKEADKGLKPFEYEKLPLIILKNPKEVRGCAKTNLKRGVVKKIGGMFKQVGHTSKDIFSRNVEGHRRNDRPPRRFRRRPSAEQQRNSQKLSSFLKTIFLFSWNVI